jgi:type IV pilus assembly protein PilA
MRFLSSRKGFTLVELMIVVAIIGVLAAIAIPNFLEFRLKAKTAEAKANLGAIKDVEVAYLAENDVYLTGQDWTPTLGADRGVKVAWNYNTRFSILGYSPEGMVFYEYRLEPVGSTTSADFTVRARGDLDNDGFWSDYRIHDSSTEITHSGSPF